MVFEKLEDEEAIRSDVPTSVPVLKFGIGMLIRPNDTGLQYNSTSQRRSAPLSGDSAPARTGSSPISVFASQKCSRIAATSITNCHSLEYALALSAFSGSMTLAADAVLTNTALPSAATLDINLPGSHKSRNARYHW